MLEAAMGKTSKDIARTLQMRLAKVSKWRVRFSRDRLAGLEDAPRPDKTAKYNIR